MVILDEAVFGEIRNAAVFLQKHLDQGDRSGLGVDASGGVEFDVGEIVVF